MPTAPIPRLLVPNEGVQKMPAAEAPIHLVQDASGVTIDDLANLYESVGFGRREHYVHVPNLIEKCFAKGFTVFSPMPKTVLWA